MAYDNTAMQYPNNAIDGGMDCGTSSHVAGQQGNLSICHSFDLALLLEMSFGYL